VIQNRYLFKSANYYSIHVLKTSRIAKAINRNLFVQTRKLMLKSMWRWEGSQMESETKHC